ncbi:MAG TPA: DUF4157 domain-containing protein, partial [Enhygromyxa sp.]|nr:DUF4157 domain-containing protein [Enhygromyxa sp.]
MRSSKPTSSSVADGSRWSSGGEGMRYASGGVPLPSDTREFMERRFGHGFGPVRVHADGNAAELSAGLHARAFTHDNHMFFAADEYAPHTHEGRRLLAHELAHTLQQRRAGLAWIQRSPADELLNASQLKHAIGYTKRRYDVMSQRAIQQLVGRMLSVSVDPDGDFGSMTARAVAAVQQQQGLTVDGMVGPETLSRLIAKGKEMIDASERPGAEWVAGQLIHLTAQLYDLPVSSALAIRLADPKAPQSTGLQAGMPVVLVGAAAFKDSQTLANAIQAGLQESSKPGKLDPRPAILTRAQERDGLAHNKGLLRDPRAVRVVQDVVRAEPDGALGRDTVQRIA